MDILILGGTGAMGTMLVELLKQRNLSEAVKDSITITSRSTHKSDVSSVRYAQGDAKDIAFLQKVLSQGWDVVVDFMSYSTAEFKERCQLLLAHASQYIFISSARVYAESDVPITEETPRLLDVCKDSEYLATDEYALAKARCENLLMESGRSNWTVVRPSITYGTYRLQLGVIEKEGWLYRALHGRSIVFSRDIATKRTAMTAGEDVARGIVALMGQPRALGECFHITSEASYVWDEILECYLQVLEEEIGKRPSVVYTDKAINLRINKYQVIYCRYFNRSFDNTKVKQFIDVDSFVDPMDGLAKALRGFLATPQFKGISPRFEAWNDCAAEERTPREEFDSWKQWLLYTLYRQRLDFLADGLLGVRAKMKG